MNSYSKDNNEKKINQEQELSWDDVYKIMPKVLELLKNIAIDKITNYSNELSTKKYLEKASLGIIQKDPYIMTETAFDEVNLYGYIFSSFAYYLCNNNDKINKIKTVILKHIIDMCNVLKNIINNKDNYQKQEIKFYIFHLINTLSEGDVKPENDFKFFKCGIEYLINK